MGLTLVTAPAVEPVTLAEAKAHLRVDHTDEDDLITGLIVAARQQAETFTGRKFVTQTWDWTLDDFPDLTTTPMRPPLAPVQSVTSITYTAQSGTSTTWASSDYTLDASNAPARITPAYGKSYPGTRDQINAVTVRMVVGYGDDADVPEAIKRAILMAVGHWYAQREDTSPGTTIHEVPRGSEFLLTPYRVFHFSEDNYRTRSRRALEGWYYS